MLHAMMQKVEVLWVFLMNFSAIFSCQTLAYTIEYNYTLSLVCLSTQLFYWFSLTISLTFFFATASNSSSCTFGFPPVFGHSNQKSDVFAPKTLHSETVFCSPTGMPTYGGTSAWAFGQTSSPLSSTTTFGVPSYAGFGSSMIALGFSPVDPLVSSLSTLVEGFFFHAIKELGVHRRVLAFYMMLSYIFCLCFQIRDISCEIS